MKGYASSDYWALKAKREGFVARSVYKLQELDKKFKLIFPGIKAVDLGAAPGSWSQWLCQKNRGSNQIVAVDIQNLSPKLQQPSLPNLRFISGNIADETLVPKLLVLSSEGYDAVFSDAAPATTGNRLVDQSASEYLVKAVIHLTTQILKRNGALVAKIFQSNAEHELKTQLKQFFSQLHSFKPKVCRSNSFEMYIIAKGFTGSTSGTNATSKN